MGAETLSCTEDQHMPELSPQELWSLEDPPETSRAAQVIHVGHTLPLKGDVTLSDTIFFSRSSPQDSCLLSQQLGE